MRYFILALVSLFCFSSFSFTSEQEDFIIEKYFDLLEKDLKPLNTEELSRLDDLSKRYLKELSLRLKTDPNLKDPLSEKEIEEFNYLTRRFIKQRIEKRRNELRKASKN